ncbi:adhesion G protein-coupled receptor L4-like isoform X2 [Dysidea avara]|uniref:adhesion G protein-coupled receptor L4-like isoform X2 n=1 Tax=Dysidea avara TaxID=196820 RepID=UPI0033177ADD
MRVWLHAILLAQVTRCAISQSDDDDEDDNFDFDCNCMCGAENIGGVLWTFTCAGDDIQRECFNDTTMDAPNDVRRDCDLGTCTWIPNRETIRILCPATAANISDDLVKLTLMEYLDWLDDLLSTENLDEEHIGEIFDATEEFLFDHLDTDNEDMYNSDYFEFELFDIEDLDDSGDIFMSHGKLGSVRLPREALCNRSSGQFNRAISKTFKKSVGNLFPGNLSSADAKFRNGSSYELGSPVISASVSCCDARCIGALNDTGVKITISHTRIMNEDETPLCVFWNQTQRSREIGSFWSTDGCDITEYNSSYSVCVCYHLTNFAVLFDSTGAVTKQDKVHMEVLGIITYVGTSLSLVALVATVIILVLRGMILFINMVTPVYTPLYICNYLHHYLMSCCLLLLLKNLC